MKTIRTMYQTIFDLLHLNYGLHILIMIIEPLNAFDVVNYQKVSDKLFDYDTRGGFYKNTA